MGRWTRPVTLDKVYTRSARAAVAAGARGVCSASQCWNVPDRLRADSGSGTTGIDRDVPPGAIGRRGTATATNNIKINKLSLERDLDRTRLVGLARQTYVQ